MPPTKKLTPAQWLDLLVARAPALRAAGILHLEIDEVIVDLAPELPGLDEADEDESERRIVRSALDDPDTFGGPVPSWRDAMPEDLS